MWAPTRGCLVGAGGPGVGAPVPRRAIGRRWPAFVLVAVALAAATFVAVDYNGLTEYFACPHTCPSGFAPDGIERAAVGSPGCSGPVGDFCFRAEFISLLTGLTLANVRFNVANPSNGTADPTAPSLPLGREASVTTLGEAGQAVAVWNVTQGSWQYGSGWPVPTDRNTTVVLNTALLSNATLANAYLYVYLTGGFQGGVGFPLFCAGC